MGKPKIALISGNMESHDGLHRVVSILCNELSATYEVYLICFWGDKSIYPIKENVHQFYIHHEEKRLRYVLYSRVKKLREFLKNEKIDVVFCEAMTPVLETFLATLGLPVKFVFHEHSSSGFRLTNRNRSKKQCLHTWGLQQIINRFTDGIVVLTEKTLQDYKDAKVPCCCIYNMLDENLLDSRGAYHCENRSIITVGRVEHGKGIDFLLEVAGKVFARHPDWHWDIYGEGEEEYVKHIRDLISENGLEKHVFLKGKCDHMYDMYSHYGIYVMTSRYEGLGMVLLEAKAKKLPLVSFDIHAGPSDIIRDGVDGYLVPPFDTDAMAEKICHLIEHPEVRRDFSDHAYGNIDKFRKDAILEKWKDLIEEMCEE